MFVGNHACFGVIQLASLFHIVSFHFVLWEMDISTDDFDDVAVVAVPSVM